MLLLPYDMLMNICTGKSVLFVPLFTQISSEEGSMVKAFKEASQIDFDAERPTLWIMEVCKLNSHLVSPGSCASGLKHLNLHLRQC